MRNFSDAVLHVYSFFSYMDFRSLKYFSSSIFACRMASIASFSFSYPIASSRNITANLFPIRLHCGGNRFMGTIYSLFGRSVLGRRGNTKGRHGAIHHIFD